MSAPESRQPRLLVISSYFHPDRGGGSAVNTDLCHGLAARGFEVTVWTAVPHYPEWRDKSGRNGLGIARERLGGFDIERFGLMIPSNAGSLRQRMLYEASFLLSLLRRVGSVRRYDAVMAFCPLVSSLAVGALGATLFRKPLWLNVQDLAAEAAAAGGIIRQGPFARLLKGIQAWLFNRAEVWSTISPVMVQRLESLRRRGQPVLHLPNWLNESLANEIRRLGGKQGRPAANPLRLLYAGNFGRKQNLVALLDGLRQCRSAFEFRLCGDGGDVEAVRAWFADNSDPRFVLGPFMDETGFARALHDCDLFVLPEIEGSGASFLPSKLTSVYASGTPVLCLSDPDSPLGHEVRSAQAGPVLRWEEIDRLDAILVGAATDSQQLAAGHRNAIERSRFFDRERILDEFAGEIRAMIARHSSREIAA